MKSQDSRRFPRYELDIPCRIQKEEAVIQAAISNISYGGARICRASVVPAPGSSLLVEFNFQGRPFSLKAHLTSRVIYSVGRIVDGGEAGYFGVEFDAPPETVQEELRPLFEALENRAPEVDWKFVVPVGVCRYCGRWSSMICAICREGVYVCDACTTKHLEAHLAGE